VPTSRTDLNSLTEKVIGSAIEVHRTLGPGLLESVYRDCLVVELTAARLRFESEQRIPLEYKGQPIQYLRQASQKMWLILRSARVPTVPL
jgi:GxxExxY protein